MPDTDTSPSISLLWPPGLENLSMEDVDRWGTHSIQDLNLNQVAGALSPDARHVNQTQIILRSLNPDPRVILYRQSVLDDCLRCPELLTGIQEMLPYISSLVQALFQAGLYVPARRARISPVDGIYAHFPVEEKPYFDMGRLGEEAHRLSEVFQKASRYSLVLLNETLSTTSPGECLYLARDIVRALKLLGVRAVYATHLHELAETEAFEDTTSDSPVVSLVAGTAPDQTTPESVRRTYKIVPAPPTGMSFAKDIARKYGISFEQLIQVLQERKVIS